MLTIDDDTDTTLQASIDDEIVIAAGGNLQFTITDGAILPSDDDVLDLGSTTYEFDNLWIDGTANIDALVADTADINAGTIDGATIGGASAAAGTFTTTTVSSLDLAGGVLTIDDDNDTTIQASIDDEIVIAAGGNLQFTITDGAILPSDDDVLDLGSTTYEFDNLWIDGTANIDALVADTADINAGTIDGATIGGASAAAGTFTNLAAETGTVTIGTAAANAGTLVIYDGVGDSTATTIKTAANIDGSYTLTLPTTDGNVDQMLKTDGAGNLTWGAPVGGSGSYDLEGSVLTIDDDDDTTLQASIDDTIVIAIAGTDQFTLVDGAMIPSTTNDIDLGKATRQFKDLHIDGTANIDALVADTADINAGTIDGATIGGASAAAGTFTTTTVSSLDLAGGVLTIDDDNDTTIQASIDDEIVIAAGGNLQFTITDGAILPSDDDVLDLGSTTYEFDNLWIDGTANIDALVADTADINAGTIDGATIGGASAAAGTFTNLAAETGTVTIGTAAANAGTLVIYDGVGDSTATTIKTAANIDGSYTLTLPTTDGNVDQMLKTDGAGNLTWGAPVGGSGSYDLEGSVLTIDDDDDTTLQASIDDTIVIAIAGTDQFTLVDGAMIPSTTNDIDLGKATRQFKDLHIDGTANIDALVADTADINAGTIDGATIGGASAAAGTFTNLAAETGTVTIGTAAANAGTLVIYDGVGDSTATTIKTAANIDGSYTLTLPDDDGTSSQFLQTDGAGNLSWSASAGQSGAYDLNGGVLTIDDDTDTTLQASIDDEIVIAAGGNLQFTITDGAILPSDDDVLDLGSTTYEFDNLWIDGTANIDALVADTADINAGTIDGATIGGASAAAGTFTNLAAETGTVTIGTAAANAGTLVIYDGVGDSTATTIKTAANIDGSFTLTLPDDDGTSSQFLQTDGAGNLSWSVSAGQSGAYDLAGGVLTIDDDDDTTLQASIDDTIVIAIAGTDQFTLVDGAMIPTTDNDIDLGKATREFKDLHIDGTANIDDLAADLATFNNTGLHILDTNASHDLIITPNSDLTADRTLTITTDDANRSVTLSGNLAVESASLVNQDLTSDASPTFANATVTAGNITFGTAGGNAGTLVIYDGIGDSTATTIKTAANIDGSFTLTLPDDDGTSSQFLQTDGAGNLSWSASAGQSGAYDLNGGVLTIDDDTDTTLQASIDDEIVIAAGGNLQFTITDGAILPSDDDVLDLGSTTYEFDNLWIDGTANIDALVADTADINAGTIDGATIGGASAAAGTFTTTTVSSLDLAGGVLTIDDDNDTTIQASIDDEIVIAAGGNLQFTITDGAILPSDDDVLDLGSTTYEFDNLWIDGTANIDALVADTAAISGGTIESSVIGGTTPAAGTFTNLAAETGTVTIGTAAANAGTLVIYDGVGDSTATTIKTAANIDGSYTLTLPDDDGTSSQFLQTDGAGNLSWSASAGQSGAYDLAGGVLTIDDDNDTTIQASIDDEIVIAAGGNLQFTITDGAILPSDDDVLDLGSTTYEFDNLWIDGTANIDALVADTADINAGTIDGATIGGASAAAGTFTNLAAETGTVTIGTAAANAGTLVIYDGVGDSTATTIKTAANIDGSYTLTLPTTDGNVDQMLKTDGAGNLTWGAPVGGSGSYDLEGSVLTIDDDDDTTLQASIDDTIVIAIAGTDQFTLVDGAMIPSTTNDIDLGKATRQFKDLHIDGTANIDALVADTADINAGTIDGATIGGASAAAGTFTTTTVSSLDLAGGVLTIDDDNDTTIQASIDDEIVIAAGGNLQFTITDGAILPSDDDVLDLGSTTYEFDNLWIDGTANIDALVADTADINAGTIDGATIGGASAAAGTFTNLAAETGTVTIGTAAANAGTLVIYDGVGDSTATTIKTAANIDGSYTLTLPTTDGNVDQMLKTDGAGNLTWGAPVGGSGSYDLEGSVLTIDDDDDTTLQASIDDTIVIAIAGTDQFTLVDGAMIPSTTNDIDLGKATRQFKDLHIDGTANIDALVADTADINAGTIDGATIGGASAAAGTFTTTTVSSLDLAGGVLTIDDDNDTTIQASIDDEIVIAAGGNLQFTITDGAILPSDDDVLDLGSTTYEFDNLWIDGTANIDALVADTADINAGTIDGATIGGASAAAGTFTTTTVSSLDLAGGVLTIDDDNDTTIQASIDDEIVIAAGGNLQFTITDGAILPSDDDVLDLGSTTYEFDNLWIDGTANIDDLVADTADINGGTIDGATIGGASAAAGTFTNLTAETGTVTIGTAANAGTLVIYDAAGDTTSTTIKTAADVDGSFTLTLPDDDGTSSQFLQTDGAGNLSWAAAGSGSGAYDLNGGVLTIDDAGDATLQASKTDEVMLVVGGTEQFTIIDGALIPVADDTFDLGGVGKELDNIFVDGTANIDDLVADTADINGGTIDGATIGGASAAAGTFTNLTAETGTVTIGTAANAGTLVIYDAAGDTTSTTIKTAADVDGSFTLTLPDDDGTSSQFLQTDGAGNLSWAAAGSGSGAYDLNGGVLTIDDAGDATLQASKTDEVMLVVGGTEQFTIIDGALIPVADDTFSIGGIGKELDNIWIDGTANIDDVVIGGGSIDDTVIGVLTPDLGYFTTLSATSAVWLGSTGGTLGVINIHDGQADGFYTTLRSADDVNASFTLTLPDAQGSASEFLQNDGAGNLSWAAAGSGSGAYDLNGGVLTIDDAGDATLQASKTDEVMLVVGGTEQFTIIDGALIPSNDDTFSLGAPNIELDNIYIDGQANIDELYADSVRILDGTLTLGVQLSSEGKIIFHDNQVDNYTTAIMSADDVNASFTLTLPDAQGSASEFLQNDGAGNLSWAAAGGGSGAYDLNGGVLTIDDAGDATLQASKTDEVMLVVGGTEQFTIIDGALIPVADDTFSLGAATRELDNIWVDGTAEIDTVNIDGGAIDGVTIGADASGNASFKATDIGGTFTLNDATGSEILFDTDSGNDGTIAWDHTNDEFDFTGGEINANDNTVFFTAQEASPTGAYTIDWTKGNKVELTLSGDPVTLTFSPEPAGPCNLVLYLLQDGGGSNTVVWPADVYWPGDVEPTLTTTGGNLDIVTFYYDSNGDFFGNASLNFNP